eukprot:10636_1
MALQHSHNRPQDWMYFKQNINDKWQLRYIRFQSPFLFIYQNEQLILEGTPDKVLIMKKHLSISKSNDRISFCGFVKQYKEVSYSSDYWIVITRDGRIIIGEIQPEAKAIQLPRTSSTDDDFKNTSQNTKYPVPFQDDIKRLFVLGVNNIKVTPSGSAEVTIDEVLNKQKFQLKFRNKAQASLFTHSVSECTQNLSTHKNRLQKSKGVISGSQLPMFPLMITDKTYDKKYYFISLNQRGVDKWYKLLEPKPIIDKIKPFISRIEMEDSSLINLEEIDEVRDIISRDLNQANSSLNEAMDKKIFSLYMNAMSNQGQGVHYWISIMGTTKEPQLVFEVFQQHLEKQNVEMSKFVQKFVESGGLSYLLDMDREMQNDIRMSDGTESFVALRRSLLKIFETMSRALPYNEVINETDATQQQKDDFFKLMGVNIDSEAAYHIRNMKELYGSDTESSDDEIETPSYLQASTSLPKAIQIRYNSGAETIFNSDQKSEVIEYLISSIWGYQETELTKNDLLPGMDAIKCLYRLCLLKEEFAPFITTILLESTELGQEEDNWWRPLTETMQNALYMFRTAENMFPDGKSRFVVEDQCKTYIQHLLILILAIIDSFDIKVRCIERNVLDLISFDDLLFQIKDSIEHTQIHSLIDKYTQSKAEDIYEYTQSQMEVTQDSLDELRTKAMQHGYIKNFSNILSNLAAFPDDAVKAWDKTDRYVYNLRMKFNDYSDSNTSDDDIEAENKKKKGKEKENEQLLSKNKALTDTIEHLQTEKNELEQKLKELEEQLIANNNQASKPNLVHPKPTLINQKPETTSTDQKSKPTPPISPPPAIPTPEPPAKIKQYVRMVKLKIPMKVIKNRMKQAGVDYQLLDDYLHPKPKSTPSIDKVPPPELAAYVRMYKLKIPIKVIKNKMKMNKIDGKKLDDWIASQTVSKPKPKPKPLSEKDQKSLAEYKKRLTKFGMPQHVVRNAMIKDDNKHLIDILFPKKKNIKPSEPELILPPGVSEKMLILPKKPMLTFHWKKINEKCLKNTIWYDVNRKFCEAKENILFEEKQIDELFAKPEEKKSKLPTINRKTSSSNAKKRIVKSEAKNILDSKVRQKLDIFLRQIQMNWNMKTTEICQHIVKMNEKALSIDHIEKLMVVSPKDTQSKEFNIAVQNVNTDTEKLSKAALFWQQLLAVDNCIKTRMILWDFKLIFKELLAEEQTKTDMLNACIKKLRNDTNFQKVLGLALDIGNYVNGNKRQGQCYGFSISTLEKLDQFPRQRNEDGTAKPSMLEYIYTLFQEKDPSVLKWTDNLQILDEAVKIDLHGVNANVIRYCQQIQLLSDYLKTSHDEHFSFSMKPFYESSSTQLKIYSQKLNKLNNDMKILREWFAIAGSNSFVTDMTVLQEINYFRKLFQKVGARITEKDEIKPKKMYTLILNNPKINSNEIKLLNWTIKKQFESLSIRLSTINIGCAGLMHDLWENIDELTKKATNYKHIVRTLRRKVLKTEFIYKRAHQKLFVDNSTDTLSQMHNIGIVMSEYGCWNHESSGFIFGRSSKSLNEFYILTEGDAVVRWNDQKQLKTPRCVSFHLMKNIDIDAKQEVNHVITSEEIARFAVVFGIVHPKYLKTKLAEYNIAII